jgi:ERCC4-related helicase
LIYIVHPNHDQLLIETCVARRLSQGHHEYISHFDPALAKVATPARFLQPVDLKILQTLDCSSPDSFEHHSRLEGEHSAALFEMILDTQRCYLHPMGEDNVLQRGSTRKITLYWSTDRFGWQQLVWLTAPPAEFLLPLSLPWYLDPKTLCCAPLQSNLPSDCLWELLNQAPIEPGQIKAWYASYQQAYPNPPIPSPRIFAPHHLAPVTPIPCLCLTHHDHEGAEKEHKDLRQAQFTLDYGGIRLAPDAPNTFLKEDTLFLITRDPEAESTALKQLLDEGLKVVSTDKVSGTSLVPATPFPQTIALAWIDFQLHAIARLRKQGWHIAFKNFPHRLMEASQWRCHVARLDREDWFNLSLDIEVEGQRIALLPLLLKLLESLPPDQLEPESIFDQPLLLPMEDINGNACLLRLSGERATNLLALLLEICATGRPTLGHPFECNRGQLVRLAALDSDLPSGHTPIEWVDDEIRVMAQRISSLEQLPSRESPASLQAELRPYQKEGLTWLQFLCEFHLAGILADDMGLGKTLQVLAHLLVEKACGRASQPSLVVVPTSLTFNWLHEARRFAPELRVLILQGAQRKSRFKQLQDYDLIITTYPLLSRDSHVLKTSHFHLLILDEAQAIKNPKSQASRIVRQLNARHRLCLTGTPLENHLGELWSLFDFLMPGLLGNAKQFRREFRLPIENHNDEAVTRKLSHRLRPFLLRRTKQQVAKDLPQKSEIVQSITLEGKQRELYEMVRLSMHRRVRTEIEQQGLARSQIVVLGALLKLRQVCCDPRLVNSTAITDTSESAKLAYLMTLLSEMIEEGRHILLFSQFTTMLEFIEAEVKSTGIDYVKLTGQTRDRESPVTKFQQGKIPLFLISLKAGGVGLNLTSADTVIHYDPWWNPAVERQATDRSHRIGQKNKVFVYKLICEGTLEEKILAMQQRKQRLTEGLYEKNSNDPTPQWNLEDIEALFSPLKNSV